MPDLTPFLPDTLGLWAAVSLMSVTALGGFITAAFGIGGGVLVLAVMASLLPPLALIPIHGVVQLGANLWRFGLLRQHVHWSLVPAFLLGSLLGVALGGQLVISLRPEVVQIGIGAFILWTLVASPPRWLRQFPVLNGALSSFLTMFFGATGPYVAAYVRAQGLDRMGHVATHALLMVLQHGLKVLGFAVLGFAFGPWLWLLAGLILCGGVGTWVGKQVLTRMSTPLFYRILNVILAVIALRLIGLGLLNLLGP